MEKLFHFDTAPEEYRADACVVSCYDARFEPVVRKFLKRRGLAVVDHLKIAGSVKSLASPGQDADREFMLRMIRISMRLHQTRLVVMVGHNECGAYGGAPPETVLADLRLAAQIVRTAEPSLAVECYFADFDGMYRVDEAGETVAAA
jgi:carbonic anhydrase